MIRTCAYVAGQRVPMPPQPTLRQPADQATARLLARVAAANGTLPGAGDGPIVRVKLIDTGRKVAMPARAREILHAVTRQYRVPLHAVLGDSKRRGCVTPRFAFMILLRDRLGWKLGQIAKLTERDHTSVLGAFNCSSPAAPPLLDLEKINRALDTAAATEATRVPAEKIAAD